MTTALIGFAVVFLLAFLGVPLAWSMLLVGIGGFAALRGHLARGAHAAS